jgi:hypothetical protein
MADTMATVEEMADWSPWVPFDSRILSSVDRLPGVYMAREGANGPVVYVGMAGERSGNGIRGRLTAYLSGKSMTSGLGEAVADRALADAEWLRLRLAEVERGEPLRATEWSRAAFARAALYVRWAPTRSKDAAVKLEIDVEAALWYSGLWNRAERTVFKFKA